MERLVQGATTKSEKMRRLAVAGFTRQEIADFLGVRYQFVRNVLVEHEKKQEQGQSGLAEARQAWRADTAPVDFLGTVKVAADGSAVIPACVLAEAGLRAGDSFVPDVAGEGDIRLLSGSAALRRAQELVRQASQNKTGQGKADQGQTGLVDEILQERRRDAGNFAKDAEKRHG